MRTGINVQSSTPIRSMYGMFAIFLMSDLGEAHSKKVISLCNKYGIVKQATSGYIMRWWKDGLELMVRCHNVYSVNSIWRRSSGRTLDDMGHG